MQLPLAQLTADPCLFPDPNSALKSPDGLLAIGGDLTPKRLLYAYYQGIFPWFNEGDPLLWWSPSVRAIFEPNSLTLDRSLKKYLKKYPFTFSCNQSFLDVMHLCAQTREETGGTWIQPNIMAAYTIMHQLDLAHSIEVWLEGELVGGCYGLQIGQLFCGESMFNLMPNTAKLALVMLQQHLSTYTQGLIDCQMPNPFLLQMGAKPLPRAEYLNLLHANRSHPTPEAMWQARALQLKVDV